MTRLACVLVAIGIGMPGLLAQTKTYALPAVATDGASIVNNVPGFMVMMEEGGSVPSEPASTCDDRADGNSKSNAGFHLEHYFAKDAFDQKVGFLRQYIGLKQAVQAKAGQATVVMETLGAFEAAYIVAKQPCVEDAHPSATRVEYHSRLIRDMTYADLEVTIYAAGPDPARKYVREMIQKIEALDYGSVK